MEDWVWHHWHMKFFEGTTSGAFRKCPELKSKSSILRDVFKHLPWLPNSITSFHRGNTTWGWFISPWDQTVPNPLPSRVVRSSLPGPWAPHSQHLREKEEREGTASETAVPQPRLTPHDGAKHPDTSVSQVTCFLLISECFSTLPPWEALTVFWLYHYFLSLSLICCIGGELKNEECSGPGSCPGILTPYCLPNP